MSKLCVALVALSLLDGASATIRLPDEFNVEKDFDVKEQWRNVARKTRCGLCKITVEHTVEAVGVNFNEDDIYDQIDRICDVEELYKQHELRQKIPGDEDSWEVAKVDPNAENARTDHTVRWQTHAMKELCDNIIRPNDDEIKDAFMKVRRRNKGKKATDEEHRSQVSRLACESIRLCTAGARQASGEL